MKMNKTEKALISKLRKVEHKLRTATDEVGVLRNLIEMPYIVRDIQSVLSKNKRTKITTTWLQRRYEMGYARAARLLDYLVANGLK